MLSLIQEFLFAPEPSADVQARAFLKFVAVLWSVHILNWGFFRGRLIVAFGIYPRRFLGLLGILGAPFLHSVYSENIRGASDLRFVDMNRHLCGNTLGLLSFGGLILIIGGVNLFYVVTIITALSSGIGIWLIGRDGYHAGFSGVVYGYFGFLLVFSFLAGSILGLVLALFLGFGYYWMFNTLIPSGNVRISWEGHFFGFLGGVLTAYIVQYIQVSQLAG